MAGKNTVIADNNTEIYENAIYSIVDDYIEQQLEGDSSLVHDNFLHLIRTIAKSIPKPPNDDIKLLDKLFDMYYDLALKYQVRPTLEVFALLVGINRTTFTDWANGEYRLSSGHGDTAKKWKEMCGDVVVHALHNQRGTDANLIFAAKSVYGMVETAPVQMVNKNQKVIGLSDMTIELVRQIEDES